MWYVVQVSTGREEAACLAIKQVAHPDLLQECFVPRYRTMKNRGGEWLPCDEVLFPGYLIVVSDCVDRLDRVLRKTPAFAKLLNVDGAFVPLSREEVSWIDAFTQNGHRTIEMSTGYIKGDRVVVTSGPLMGREGWIRKVNHRKKVAYLEIQMFGRTLNVEVGLRIVRKRS